MVLFIMLTFFFVGAKASFNNSYVSPPAIETAQQQGPIAVKGTVADSNGPLVGATVQIMGTNRGTVTDAEGNYSITAPRGATLQFSYVGFKMQTAKVNNARIDITLEEDDSKMLEELVVTEFGMNRPKRNIGSSAQNLSASDIIDSGRDNFISALQGRISGINVVNSSGSPGASTSVTLRSITSLSGNNQPLYVVDGIPMNNSSFSAYNSMAVADVYASRTLDFSSRGNDFNPEDVESITVLKGAAAAALYGSNASNGAIIITTKKGTAGKGKVSYSNRFRWDTSYGLPEQQTKYANGAYGSTNYYNINHFGGLYPEGTQLYNNLEAILQTGFTSVHNVSVETGTDKLTMRAAASFTDQIGTLKSTDYKRNNFSLSGKADITKWLRFESSMQYAATENNKMPKGTSGPLYYALRWPVIDDMSNYMDPDGIHMRYPYPYIDGDLVNPLFLMNKNKYYDEADRMIGNVTGIVQPNEHFFFRAQYGWDVGAQTFETSEHPLWATYNYSILAGKGGTYTLTKENFSDLSMNFLTGWNDKFIDNRLTVTTQVGYHQYENKLTRLTSYGKNYIVWDLASINNVDPATVISKKRATIRRIQAISGQAEFGWDNMAFVTLRGRNDWASTLPPDNQSYFYPAVEGSFILTELPLLKENKYIDYLKLRGAIARVGKDTSPLSILPELEQTQLTGGGLKYGYTGPNLKLKPEMTTSREIGFEGRFLNGRIVSDFTYFNTRCTDQIVSGFRMSYATGFVLNTRNIGDFKTWGWESHVDGDIIRDYKGLRWNVGVNLSHTGSKTLSLPVAEYYETYTNGNSAGIRLGTMVGDPVTSIHANDYERNDKGEVLIDPNTGTPVVSTAWTHVGDREPLFRFGLSTELTWNKQWRLNALFSGKYKATVINGTGRYLMGAGLSWESVTRREQGPVVLPGVLKDGNENSDNPTPNNIALQYGQYGSTIYAGGAIDWIETGVNYMRLSELRLSYQLTKAMLAKLTNGLLSYAQIYVSGNDLFTLTNYSGLDAVGNTMSASAGGVGGEGYDTWGLPSPRGITVGFSVQF
ncbi:MAG: SusC/RagA family TonB-linked outer membrane protein [Dysgonamonadaceae bacterium]|nr:SusC/RagA family TonB-linked outer membrane protein [Dysgonamonadaceae bacterium]